MNDKKTIYNYSSLVDLLREVQGDIEWWNEQLKNYDKESSSYNYCLLKIELYRNTFDYICRLIENNQTK